jgi:CubicO group peptidase (beta-lactamase class C family)
LAEIHGTYEDRFQPVADALSRSIDDGLDIGASVAVMLEGEPVVDIWGGHLDAEQTEPWEQDTIVNVFSTTKTMTALCALILADRGELEVDSPVKRYWPEFGAAGKQRVTVGQLLGHSAGLSGWDERLEPEDLADWEKCTGLLAEQEPWWEPGTAPGYHAVTQGYLVGEVVRRITGQTLGTFFAEQVAGPLGADFHIGLPADSEADARVRPLIQPDDSEELPRLSEIGVRTLSNPPITGATSFEPWWRRCEIPAANGQGNARSVATVQSVISCAGEARGTRLLSGAGVEALFTEQSSGTDLVLGVPLRFGLGYGLSSETMPMGPRTCAWGGYGGSLVISDLDTKLTVAYVMNRMEPGMLGDMRGAAMVAGALQGLFASS